MNDKKIINLIKGENKKNTIKNNEIVLSSEEERDIKAKEKAKELLQDIELPLKKENNSEIIEFDLESKEEIKSKEWLEEQVTLLSNEVNLLKEELSQSKEDYSKLFENFQKQKNEGNIILSNNEDSVIKMTVIKLFNEIQANYFNMINPLTGKSNLIIPPIAFMNRLILFFPFLADEKKY